ncbi:MAG TPA: hypothetical protein VGC77_02660 [Rhodopseudomonas sp.]|uniref:hypothetical protein n=1 Tax=Rhodopseudomonas sp. TaxID=1078 RepID=UPI002ED983DE
MKRNRELLAIWPKIADLRQSFPTSSQLPLLEQGARVRMNGFGRERHPHYRGREGTIVGVGSPGSCRVQFDDTKTPVAIYRGYLELVPAIGQ